jgi:hypothetical protein
MEKIQRSFGMNSIKAVAASLAMLLGVGALAIGQASASPLSGQLNGPSQPAPSNIELVDHAGGMWTGHRFRDFDDDLSFGLSAPLYAYDDDVYDDIDDGYSTHVAWCMERYRSYDPASDSFLGYDGLRHRCNSPF